MRYHKKSNRSVIISSPKTQPVSWPLKGGIHLTHKMDTWDKLIINLSNKNWVNYSTRQIIQLCLIIGGFKPKNWVMGPSVNYWILCTGMFHHFKVSVSRDCLAFFYFINPTLWAPDKQVKMVSLKNSFSRIYSNFFDKVAH